MTLTTQSCMVTRTTIGEGPVGRSANTMVYSKTKQLYIFFGLIPLGHSQPAIPSSKDLQIKTSYNIGDVLINCITLGIVSSQTIKVIVYSNLNTTNQ